jgi:hypothetical protein
MLGLTSRVADESEASAVEKYSSTAYNPDRPGYVPPLGGRAWDGYNPFHQPANTTDYYGSGDVDNDGNLAALDVSLARDMADGIAEPVIRADVNGDGDVDNSDVSLINSALIGGILPAWWNSLTNRAQRNNWIDRILEIDRTNEHWYDPDFFVCHHFAYQTGINGAFLRADFATQSTKYNGGQTVFNVPLYFVNVGAPTGHAINAILVGDDPLNFEDWRFIEPRDDSDVVPGGWNMRYGSTVKIQPQNLYWNPEVVVEFYVDANGWSLVDCSENLITTRPVSEEKEPDNRPDLWNPRIISAGSGAILFERAREDMSRTTDIHIADLPFDEAAVGEPIIMDSQFSRLLDVFEEPDGTVHILWEGKSDEYKQTMFYGILSVVDGTVSNVRQVTPGLRLTAAARLAVTPDGEIHVFWFENYGYSGSYDFGIHWSKWNGLAWETPQKLTADVPQSQDADWLNRHFARYVFDTVVLDNGEIILVWDEMVFPNFYISQLRYDGVWSSSRIEDTGWDNSLRGLDLCKDSNGIVHLAYWRGDRQQPGGMGEGRGNLYHRTFDGVTWSAAVILDVSGGVCCPRMAAGPNGEIYLVWERKVADSVIPIWSKYADNAWSSARELNVRSGANAWYPTIGRLPDGNVMAAWSSRSDDLVTIEMKKIWPTLPVAKDGSALSWPGTPARINLQAQDDGFPDPPGILTYIITSLPGHGSLSDPEDGIITTVPYIISNYSARVVYTPDEGYCGPDEFTFEASDGGVPPDGGESNIATVTIEVLSCTDITIGTGTSSWYYPMYTWYHDSRVQVIYLSSEIGASGAIAALALNVEGVPGQTMNNWTIRMKHTTMSAYDNASLDATGWTVVYEGNEPPGETGWRIFEFSSAFNYNNINNLVIDFSHNNDSYTIPGFCMCSISGGRRSAYAYSDSGYGDPLDWSGSSSPTVFSVNNKVPNIRLTICGNSNSASTQCPAGDLNLDCDIDFMDFEILAWQWQQPPGAPSADIAPLSGDGIVDMNDLRLFVDSWLWGK